jgi:hypothetical protein
MMFNVLPDMRGLASPANVRAMTRFGQTMGAVSGAQFQKALNSNVTKAVKNATKASLKASKIAAKEAAKNLPDAARRQGKNALSHLGDRAARKYIPKSYARYNIKQAAQRKAQTAVTRAAEKAEKDYNRALRKTAAFEKDKVALARQEKYYAAIRKDFGKGRGTWSEVKEASRLVRAAESRVAAAKTEKKYSEQAAKTSAIAHENAKKSLANKDYLRTYAMRTKLLNAGQGSSYGRNGGNANRSFFGRMSDRRRETAAAKAAGKSASKSYFSGYNMAANTIKARLLTGLLPNRANLTNLVRGRLMDNSFSDTGANAGNIFSRAFGNALGGLQTVATSALVGAAAASAAILGSGINRALNLEDARAKLQGLRYDAAQTEGIIKNVEDAVINTRFSLDQGVTASASAIAAGIKPGEELTQYMKSAADAATIAGTDLEKMAYIFNKIQSNTTIFAQEGNMLADRGIPIWAWLAENRKLSVRELKKLVEEGEITALEFREVIQKNIGGVALKSADTTRGAFTNMRIAYARLGAAISAGALPIAKQFFTVHRNFADFITKKLAPSMSNFWASFTPKAVQWLANFGASLEKLVNGGYKLSEGKLGQGIKAVVDELMKIKFVSSGIDLVKKGFQGIGDIFVDENGKFRSFNDILQKIINSADWVIWGFKHLYQAINGDGQTTNFLNELFTLMGEAWNEVRPLLQEMMPVFKTVAGDLFKAFGSGLKELLPGIIKMLPSLGQAFMDIAKEVVPLIQEILPQLPGIIKDLAVGAVTFIKEAMPYIKEIIPLLVKGLIELARVLANILPPLVEVLKSLFTDGTFLSFLGGFVKALVVIIGFLIKVITFIGQIIAMLTVDTFASLKALVTGDWANIRQRNTEAVVRNTFGWDPGAIGEQQRQGYDIMTTGVANRSQWEQVVQAQRPNTTYQFNNSINSQVDADRMMQEIRQLIASEGTGSTYSYGGQ